jgi:hypothetical protein
MTKGKTSAEPDLSHISPDLRPLARRITDFELDPTNPMDYDEADIAGLVASFREFGQREVLVVNKQTGFYEAGNVRAIAAVRLGETDPRWQYVAVSLEDDDDITARRYAITANATARQKWAAEMIGDVLGLSAQAGKGDIPGASQEWVADLMARSQIEMDIENLVTGDAEYTNRSIKEGVGPGGKDRPQSVRVVLFVGDDLPLIERALMSTGEKRRGQALRVICEAYLNGKAAKGQPNGDGQNIFEAVGIEIGT